MAQKNKKLKALQAEMNTKSIDEKSNVLEIENLKAQLAKVNEKLLHERKAKERLVEQRQALENLQMQQCLSASSHLQAPSIKHSVHF